MRSQFPLGPWAAMLCVAAFALVAAAQEIRRKPDAPTYKPPPPVTNVADERFRSAFRQLGFIRLATFVHVHGADVVAEARTTTQTALLTVGKEDQTNAWRVARALAERLRSFLHHREIREQLVGLGDLGAPQAAEVRSLVLRDEQEAARQIGKAIGADVVLILSLTHAVAEDASGARYGASYFLADAKRGEKIDGWSWDMVPDRDGAYPTPWLNKYAGHAAIRIRRELLRYADQAASPAGGVRHYQTIRFFGVKGDALAKLSEAIGRGDGVEVLRSELETRDGVAVATLEVDTTLDPARLSEAVKVTAAQCLAAKVSARTAREGTLEFDVSPK